MLQISGVVVLALACAMFGLSIRPWTEADPEILRIQDSPTAVETFRETNHRAADPLSESAPVVLQAEAFAAYLNPPKGPDKTSATVLTASSAPSAPPIRPAAPSAKFKLHGTSYYPNQPGRSMALIAEVGAAEGSERWMKEGARLGHFVIHEIRRGAIVYRDGENLREMAVERGASPPSLVRDLRPGSLKVSAAMDGGGPILPAPSGPNGVETAGGD